MAIEIATGFAGAAASSGGGPQAWTSPANVLSSNNVYASAERVAEGENLTQFLLTSTFGLAIPVGSTIKGVQAEIEFLMNTGPIINGAFWSDVRLTVGGLLSGENRVADGGTLGEGPEEFRVFGGSSTLWGLALTREQVIASGFGLGFMCGLYKFGGGINPLLRIDSVRINVHYEPPPGKSYQVAPANRSTRGLALR